MSEGGGSNLRSSPEMIYVYGFFFFFRFLCSLLQNMQTTLGSGYSGKIIRVSLSFEGAQKVRAHALCALLGV